jgi:hypothetical protein
LKEICDGFLVLSFVLLLYLLPPLPDLPFIIFLFLLHLSIYVSIYLSIYLSVCLSVCLSLYISIYLSMYVSMYLSIYLWLYSPLFDLGRFFQIFDPIHIRSDSLDGGSARLKAATYTQNNQNTGKNGHKHPCFNWDSNSRTKCLSGRRQFMP